MGSFLDKIAKRLAVAKGSETLDGKTMTGEQPNKVIINPDIVRHNESFKSFADVLTETKLSASGSNAEYHVGKYIKPYIGKKDTHTLASPIEGLSTKQPVTIHGHEVINGKYHAIVNQNGGRKKKVLFSKLKKPISNTENEGHKYEKDFADRLKNKGIMPKDVQTAGSSAGTDFVAENKRKAATHKGRVADESRLLHQGETKQNTSAAFGQLTIHHTPEKGWHISDKARANRPQYAAEIEKAGILDHMNKHHSDPEKSPVTASGRAKSVDLKHPDLKPAEAYLKDHHVEFLQVGGGYGTYKVGDEDNTGHGLPSISGKGKWTIREKQRGNKKARTVQFRPDGAKGLDRSHVNLDHDPHLNEFANTLGHGDTDNNKSSPANKKTVPKKSSEETSEPERHHTLFWGRVNPPTAGHEQAYNVVRKVARQNGGTSSMVLSRSTDPKKNPLTPEQKEKHAKRAFSKVNTSVADPQHPTLLHQLSKLHEQGVTNLHMVAGSDRHPEYKKLINQYNGVKGNHGYYNFKKVELHSAGERDPDEEGTAGISASSQRAHATNGRQKEFAAASPSTMKPAHVKELYNDVRTGLSTPAPKKLKNVVKTKIAKAS
jgi:hypothetical protein